MQAPHQQHRDRARIAHVLDEHSTEHFTLDGRLYACCPFLASYQTHMKGVEIIDVTDMIMSAILREVLGY